MKQIEKEYKFKIDNVGELFNKVRGAKPFVFYCKDEIYGKGIGYKDTKIRKRTIISPDGIDYRYEITKLIESEDNINQSEEENIKSIPEGYKLENSYDKTRFMFFDRGGCLVTIDIYAIGIFCEIEGKEKEMNVLAKKLGFKLEDNIKDNIDLFYVNWAKKNKRKELLNWGFGKL